MFKLIKIDAAYVNALTELVVACRAYGTKINEVNSYNNGWLVTFEGVRGDAICHDGSYGSPCYMGSYDPTVYHNDWSESGRWETIGMPWDGEDVSVHSAEWLALMIARLQAGATYNESWEEE